MATAERVSLGPDSASGTLIAGPLPCDDHVMVM